MLLWYVITVASDYCAVNNNSHSTLFVRYFRLGTLCNHLQKRQHRRCDFKVLRMLLCHRIQLVQRLCRQILDPRAEFGNKIIGYQLDKRNHLFLFVENMPSVFDLL